jgi:undecaprenyl phosphate-alpha-L-ara4N flippase subunit ArnE
MGVISYAIGAILLIIALKYGDLSLIYPFVALSFIWVALLSIVIFHERISLINWLGIFIIIIGVSLIGYGSKKWK